MYNPQEGKMKDFDEKYDGLKKIGKPLYTIKRNGEVIGELWETGQNWLVVVLKEARRLVELGISKANDPVLYNTFVGYWKIYSVKNIQEFKVFPKLHTMAAWEVQL